MDMTRVGIGMDMTRVGGNMDMTRVGGGMDMTRVGGSMDVTRVGGGMDMTRVGGNMDMTRVGGSMDMTRVGGSMDMTRAGGIMDMTRVDDNVFADEVGCRKDTDYVSKTGGAMDMFTARFKNRLNSTNFGNSTSYANDINMDLTKPANKFQSISCYREPVAKDGEADDNMEMTGVIKLNQPKEENIKYSETSSSPEPIEVGEDSVFERTSP